MNIKYALPAALVCGMFISGQTFAALVDGGFSIDGGDNGTALIDFSNPTSIDFQPPVGGGFGQAFVGGGASITGDFTSIFEGGEQGRIHDVTENPFGPDRSFINIGSKGVFFDLTSFSFESAGADDGFIAGVGTGFLRVRGFEETAALFRFTSQDVGAGNNTWSASVTTEGASVPEPATLALLSIGLLGAGATRRKVK